MRLLSPSTKAARPGVAAVELAILLPLLCFLFVITVDFARVFYYSVTITNCASIGAVYASSDPTAANDSAGILARVQKDASNLDLQQLTVASTTNSSTNPTSVTVTVSYPFTTITNFPGVPSLTTLTRTVQMNVTPFVPN
jgi:Flp pilus assembly protein TadG